MFEEADSPFVWFVAGLATARWWLKNPHSKLFWFAFGAGAATWAQSSWKFYRLKFPRRSGRFLNGGRFAGGWTNRSVHGPEPHLQPTQTPPTHVTLGPPIVQRQEAAPPASFVPQPSSVIANSAPASSFTPAEVIVGDTLADEVTQTPDFLLNIINGMQKDMATLQAQIDEVLTKQLPLKSSVASEVRLEDEFDSDSFSELGS